MKARGLRSFVLGGALALAQPGCVGGQTGQPTSVDCVLHEIPEDELWHDSTTAEQAAHAFVGAHDASLRWFAGAPGDDGNVVALDDSLLLRVSRRDGALRIRSCQNELHVPVSLELTSSASGIAERVDTELEIWPGAAPLRATFHFETDALRGDGELLEVSSGVSPSGELVPLAGDAPGGWARIESVR